MSWLKVGHPRAWLIGIWIAMFLLPASVALAQRPVAGTRDISGTIGDVDGNPVANATVAVTGGGPTATSGADGTFKLAKVPATNLAIDVTAEGFTTRQVTVIGARAALQLQVVLVRPAAPPPVETRTIGGVITDGTRAPIANATVTIRGTSIATGRRDR